MDNALWYIVMRLLTWDDLTVQPNIDLPIPIHLSKPGEGEDQPMGFLPMFRTEEEAVSWAEDGKYSIKPVMIGKG